jgi:hypothetical protein
VRDFLLNDALKRLTADAAVRLSALVAEGEQIPFDVAENDGPESLFYRYEPLTSRFVLEREDQLRSLPSFAPARDAADAAGVAASFLESCGETVPADPRERSSKMLIVFLAGLWEGSTEFSLDRERLDAALAVLDAESRDADDAEILIAPVVGLKMAVPSLELPHGVRLIRADAIDSPVEAMRSDGMGRSAWEPQFLAVAEQHDEPDSAEAALDQLRELISVMRLFKAGGVGLGPYAFAPTGDGHWRRITTGVPATRPGGYRLSDEEAQRLAEFATKLEARPDPDGALSWAVARFEMGCGRDSAMEGLSDHLLSLRAVLEGHGPVGASLPMRASALIADETTDRIEARGKVEDALELERSLMNGTPIHGRLDIAAWVEEGARRLLREAALGELGNDLNAAADESLIASGLEGGDVEIAMAPELDDLEVITGSSRVSPAAPGREAEEAAADGEALPSADDDRNLTFSEEAEGPGESFEVTRGVPDTFEVSVPENTLPESEESHMNNADTRILEPIPAEDEIRITATNWLDEVEVEESTLDFPAVERDLASRERVDTPRVRHLFPVPDDADWEVRELDYDRHDRAG